MLLQTLHIREQQRETTWKETLTRLGLNGLSVEDVEKAKNKKKRILLHIKADFHQTEGIACIISSVAI